LTPIKDVFVTIPEVKTGEINGVTSVAVQVSATLISLGGATTVTEYGHCWSVSPYPVISNNKTSLGSTNAPKSFTSALTGLNANTPYYVRAYAVNSAGTGYGEQISFTTARNTTLPTVSTVSYSNVTHNSATVSGTVSDDGGAGVTERGICYSTSSSPTASLTGIINGSGTGSFNCTLTGLSAGTTYYVRAYAINSVGMAYGEQISFTTAKNITVPVVETGSCFDVSNNSVTVSGAVSDDGGANVTQRGICYSGFQYPTINSDKVSGGSGTGSFDCTLTGLSENHIYYARAYATNSAGTAYGEQISFVTAKDITVPVVETGIYPFVWSNSAIVFGAVTDDGGSSVTRRGICYSISPYPDINNSSSINEGSGTGSFSCTMSGLYENTTYYVRAYASNRVGTAYGNQISFTTPRNQSAATYGSNPSVGTYTRCSGGDYLYGNCSDKSVIPNNIIMAVTSITSSKIRFSVEKCSGTFTHTGTLYLKEGGICGTNLYSTSYSIGNWYVEGIEITNNLQVGDSKTYYAVIVSATTDRYYAGPITVYCQ
jgi:hypothetical protein